MNTKSNGGAAFPDPGRAQSAKQREQLTDMGMSLRDYFAAKAMQAITSRAQPPAGSDGSWPDIAARSYAAADAMLEARVK